MASQFPRYFGRGRGRGRCRDPETPMRFDPPREAELRLRDIEEDEKDALENDPFLKEKQLPIKQSEFFRQHGCFNCGMLDHISSDKACPPEYKMKWADKKKFKEMSMTKGELQDFKQHREQGWTAYRRNKEGGARLPVGQGGKKICQSSSKPGIKSRGSAEGPNLVKIN